jgi:hypothetical protein
MGGHGTQGPHRGIGKLCGSAPPVVADRWLGRALMVVEETEAADKPARTTDIAKMRTASFIVG